MKRARGVTILEVSFAGAILIVALLGAWGLAARADAGQRDLWDELQAQEWATTTLERARFEPDLAPTPPEGRALEPRPDAHWPIDFEVRLHVVEVPDTPSLLELRAIATWTPPLGPRRIVERCTYARKPL